jgi:hypothetical protein
LGAALKTAPQPIPCSVLTTFLLGAGYGTLRGNQMYFLKSKSLNKGNMASKRLTCKFATQQLILIEKKQQGAAN